MLSRPKGLVGRLDGKRCVVHPRFREMFEGRGGVVVDDCDALPPSTHAWVVEPESEPEPSVVERPRRRGRPPKGGYK